VEPHVIPYRIKVLKVGFAVIKPLNVYWYEWRSFTPVQTETKV